MYLASDVYASGDKYTKDNYDEYCPNRGYDNGDMIMKDMIIEKNIVVITTNMKADIMKIDMENHIKNRPNFLFFILYNIY